MPATTGSTQVAADQHIDPRLASAETQLDRVDDGDDGIPVAADTVADDEFGVHVDDPQIPTPDDEPGSAPELGEDLGDEVADALDAVAEAFNARDLEAVVESLAEDAEVPGVLGNDRENLPGALESLWRRRPTSLLLRGECEGAAIGVLWEHDGEAWWPIAAVHIDDVVDSRIGVLEVSEDPELVERIACEPPETDELDEGARWAEWDEGAVD